MDKVNNTTRTINTRSLDQVSGNIYESLAVISKRANQISVKMKEEINNRMSDFGAHLDNLEEIFENREQIEVSRQFEKMPKPWTQAMQEFLDGKTYFRNPSKEKGNNA